MLDKKIKIKIFCFYGCCRVLSIFGWIIHGRVHVFFLDYISSCFEEKSKMLNVLLIDIEKDK